LQEEPVSRVEALAAVSCLGHHRATSLFSVEDPLLLLTTSTKCKPWLIPLGEDTGTSGLYSQLRQSVALMGDRTPFQQRVDEDLQQFVDAVAQQTNLSKADVMDEALRRLRENSTITEEGQFLVDDTYSAPDAEHGDNLLEELLANQQKMLSAIEEGIPTTGRVDVKNNSQTRSPTVDSTTHNGKDEAGSDGMPVRDDESEGKMPKVATAEATIASLSNEMNHDECLDPDVVAEISVGGPDSRVKKTPRHLLPAVQAMINHKQADIGGQLDRGDGRDPITETLGLSAGSARNYRKRLVGEGIVLPTRATMSRSSAMTRTKTYSLLPRQSRLTRV